MTLQTFIRRYRREIDSTIRAAVGPGYGKIDDEERELWIANDEGLYNWARSEGVDV